MVNPIGEGGGLYCRNRIRTISLGCCNRERGKCSGWRGERQGNGSARVGEMGDLYHASKAERTIWRHDIMGNKRG